MKQSNNSKKNQANTPNYKSRQERPERPIQAASSQKSTTPPSSNSQNSRPNSAQGAGRPQNNSNGTNNKTNPNARPANPLDSTRPPMNSAARRSSAGVLPAKQNGSGLPAKQSNNNYYAEGKQPQTNQTNRSTGMGATRPQAGSKRASTIDQNERTQLNHPRSKLDGQIPSAIGPNEPTHLNWPTSPQKAEPKTKKAKKPKVWLWAGFAALLVLGGVGLFFYFRTSNFVNETLGAYNAPSLLKATASVAPPTAVPTPTLAPTVNAPINAAVPTAMPTAIARPTATATPDNSPAIIQKIKRGERLTALLLGYGGTGHDGAFLSDTILLLTYDPAKKAVTMVNIPRDLFVLVPYGGPKIGFWGKINSAFSYVMESTSPAQLSPRYQYRSDLRKVDAAVNLTKDIVEEVTGVPIDYWAAVNFDGFRNFVDAIGGVDVNVETAFDDYEYPSNDNPEIDASVKHIHFDTGLQHMDGERAIEYSRSRHSIQDGSDFNRSKRQMRVIQAAKEKLLKPDILFKALGVMDALQGKIRTSLTFDELTALANYYRSGDGAANAKDVMFVSQILSSNFLYDTTSSYAGYILVPQAGQGNYKDIQEWIQQGLAAPEIRYENLKVQVQNGTGLSKYTASVTEDLQNRGFNMVQPLWANLSTITTILDYSNGKAANSLKVLNGLFPGAYVKTVVRSIDNRDGPDLVVLLGQNYLAAPTKDDTAAPARNTRPAEVADLSGSLSPSPGAAGTR